MLAREPENTVVSQNMVVRGNRMLSGEAIKPGQLHVVAHSLFAAFEPQEEAVEHSVSSDSFYHKKKKIRIKK